MGAFTVDEFEQAWGKIEWGHQKFIEMSSFRHAGKNIEKGGDLAGKSRAGCQEA